MLFVFCFSREKETLQGPDHPPGGRPRTCTGPPARVDEGGNPASADTAVATLLISASLAADYFPLHSWLADPCLVGGVAAVLRFVPYSWRVGGEHPVLLRLAFASNLGLGDADRDGSIFLALESY